MAAAWAGAAVMLAWAGHDDSRVRARLLSAEAAAAATDLGQGLGAVDRGLAAAAALLGRGHRPGDGDLVALMGATLPQVRALAVLDRQGDLVAKLGEPAIASLRPLSGRHRMARAAGLMVTATPDGGMWLSRPVFDRQGGFQGMVAASVTPGSVAAMLEPLLAHHRRLELVGADGASLIVLGRQDAGGDGDRVFGESALADLPLVVRVGGDGGMDADWWRQAIALVAVLVPLTLGVAAALLYRAGGRAAPGRGSRDRERLVSVFNSAGAGIALIDEGGRITEVNDALCDLLAQEREQLERRPWRDLVLASDRDSLGDAIAQGHQGARSRAEVRFVHDLEPVWVEISLAPAPGDCLIAVVVDITARRSAEADRQKMSLAVAQSPSSIVITDAVGDIEYVNPTFERVTGYRLDEVRGANPRFLRSGLTEPTVYADLWLTITGGREWRGEFCNRRKDGSIFWEHASVRPITDDHGRITHYIAAKEDITARKEYEERLLQQANYDPLTGLANRFLAFERLAQGLSQDGGRSVLLFIDLDTFKKVNDTLGHDVGDQALQEAGRRLAACVTPADTVARLGADEFLVVCEGEGAGDPSGSADALAQRIWEAFQKPFHLAGQEVFLTVSIGVARPPEDGEDVTSLLRSAEAAMREAKQAGRNVWRRAEPRRDSDGVGRLRMESALRRALEADQLDVHYQPILAVEGRRLAGAEALVRWNDPELGPVPPDRFIPLAEESGLIHPLGSMVLERACRQARIWRQALAQPFTMSVNVSAVQFRDGGFVDDVAAILTRTGLPATGLALEFTEGILIEDVPERRAGFTALSDMGVRLSIDDFGTGYSSLGYLKRFPFDTLKIDRAFIAGVTTNSEDAALADAILAMAHSLGLKVVAEGVETDDQFQFLRNHECDLVQGYLLGRPMAPSDLEAAMPALACSGD